MNASYAARIIAMRDADLALRDQLVRRGKLGRGYDEEMEQLHNRNAEELHRIIQAIGYPTIERVGREASAAAWLIIQHAISRPVFMRWCRDRLAEDVKEGQADPKQLAYLSDRIAVFSDEPQLYGTQHDWDHTGRLSPNAYDDPQAVDRRRRAIGLPPLAEQTRTLRERAVSEKQTPPPNSAEHRIAYDKWRKRVGWIE